MKPLYLSIFIAVLSLSQLSLAASQKKAVRVKAKSDTTYVSPPLVTHNSEGRWAQHYGPLDFSGQLALNSPGVGLKLLAAYRIVDGLVPELDDSLSVESGLGFISVSDTFGIYGYSYSYVEIPFMARWDIHLRNSRFTVGPRTGFYYLSGGTQTVNGVSVSTRGGSLYFEFGGDAFFQLSDQFALRADIEIGGFTSLCFGVTYYL